MILFYNRGRHFKDKNCLLICYSLDGKHLPSFFRNILFDGLMIFLDIKEFTSVLCVYMMLHGNYGHQCEIHNFIIAVYLSIYSAIILDDSSSNQVKGLMVKKVKS